MTITQLEYLVAVDQHKSFAQAAEKCFVTQPTLSMQIKKLEEELNVIIFDRSKKPVLTTEIGKKIVEQAKRCISEARIIPDLAEAERGEVKGRIKVGIIPTVSPYLLPLFITDFIRKYDKVQLVVDELLTHQVISKLKNDEIDMGIVVSPISDSSLIEIPLYNEPFVVYMADGHPLYSKSELNAEDLNLEEMWLLKEGHCFRNQVVNICGDFSSKALHAPLLFESGSLETLKRIVEQQFGYTLLPELAINKMSDEEQRHIRRFSEPEPVREVSIIVKKSFLKQQLIESLKQSIVANLPEKIRLVNQKVYTKVPT